AQANIGIESGIVMSTGMALDVDDMNASGSTSSATSMGQYSDPDLASLVAPLNVADLCIFEIKFIPYADTVEFNYVFGSEEYEEYVCTPFNDVFGFFISGPGINGPFSNNAENLAILPDGTAVAINNVNNGSPSGFPCSYDGNFCPCNAEYFTDNGGGNGTGMHSDVCFGGYTVPLVAEAIVQCGLSYHIK